MNVTRSTHKEMKNAFRIVTRTDQLGDLLRCEEGKLDPRGTGCLDVSRIHLAQNWIR
jgi:hypothetical protein